MWDKREKKVFNIEIYFSITIGVMIIIGSLVRILKQRKNIKINIFMMIVGITLVVCGIYLILTGINK